MEVVTSWLKKLVQREGMTCHCKRQHREFKKILLWGPYSTGKTLKYRTIKCGDRAQWADVVQCSHINRMQERVMQTERASEPVFAIKTSSRRVLGGNPRMNSISPHSGASLPTHMRSTHRKSKGIKSKGEQPPCLTQQPHHPPTATQGTKGLTLTPARLLSISFEECTGFIKPTQTGAPPPPPQTHTLCSSTINTPRQRAAEEKPPEPGAALAGEHREPLSWQGHGEARDKGSSVFGKR